MTHMSKYRDKRSEFFRDLFEKAANFDRYLVDMEEKHRLRWLQMDQQLKLPPELLTITAAFKRTLRIISPIQGASAPVSTKSGETIILAGRALPF